MRSNIGNPTYQMVLAPDGTILLTDMDGDVSVTNSAECVVETMLQIYPEGLRILYRDTDGRWDELKHDGTKFTGFAPIDAATRQKYNLVDAK